MALAPYYRQFELPWSPTAEVEQRFRKVVRNTFIFFGVLVLIISFLPLPESAKFNPDALPDRVVNLVLEQRKPPPPPVVEPEKKPEEPKPVEKPEIKPEPKPLPSRLPFLLPELRCTSVRGSLAPMEVVTWVVVWPPNSPVRPP